MTTIYLLFPPGGAVGPCLSYCRSLLFHREHFQFSQAFFFDTPRQKQNKYNGVKKLQLLRLFFTPSCCTLVVFLIFSALFSDRCLQAKNSTFNLLRSSILMWRTSSHMNYLFNPAQFLQRVWRLLDELVFLSVKTLSISSAFFLFPDGSLLNPNNLLLFVLLPSLIPAEEFSHFWLESAVGWKKDVFAQLKEQNFSRTETMSLNLIMKQIQISLKKNTLTVPSFSIFNRNLLCICQCVSIFTI